MSDQHTRRLFDWQRQIVGDHDLPRSALHVAFVIADHVNRETGIAWPGQDRIAEMAGLSKSGVRKAIAALAERGHLDVSAGQGFRVTSRYRMVIKPGAVEKKCPPSDTFPASQGNEKCPSGDTFPGSEEANKCPVGAHKCPPSDTVKCPPSDTEPSELNRLKEPSEVDTPYNPPGDLFAEDRRASDEPPASDEPAGLATDEGRDPSSGDGDRGDDGDAGAPPPDAAGADADGFEAFWQHYPRRVAKGAARRAWSKAIRKADQGEIIRGAMRYAAERDGQDPRFTKHPATWLRGECWADDPAPAANVVPFTGGRRGAPSGMDAAAALIAAHAGAEAEASGGWGL